MTSSAQLFTNNAIALLNANIGPHDLVIQLPPGYGASYPLPTSPSEFFLVTLESVDAPLQREIVKISVRTGDTLIVASGGRGFEGTTPQSWAAGSTLVDHRITAGTLRSFQGHWGPSTTLLSIAPTSTEVANVLDITGANKSCKWLITIQTADGRICMSEILAVYRPSSPKFTQYARVGDRINYDAEVTGTVGSMVLTITNNDTSAFSVVDIIRLQHHAE